jgi:hypothetical protein
MQYAKQHHFVPRWYLEGFTDQNSGLIHAYGGILGDAVNYLTIYQPESLRFRDHLPSSDGFTDCRDGHP